MSVIHNQHIAAVASLEALGFSFDPEHGWRPPLPSLDTRTEAVEEFAKKTDTMLISRSDHRAGCPEESEGVIVLELISYAAEFKHWPSGMIPSGRG